MAANVGSSFAEGQSTNRPPLFNGSNYPYWKARMKIFIQASDYDLWGIIVNGPHTPTHVIDGMHIPKPERDWNDADKKMAQLNAKAMNVLYCSLDANEFNRISTCVSAKEIWDRLEVTHEGTNQVKESKINMLVHKYELFSMQSDESIACMFTRFTDIINSLKSLGKSYANTDLVRKILRSLPRSWEAKVTAIQEAKDLNSLPLEELLGSLMTHELTMKQHQDEEVKRRKPIALKAATTIEDSSSEDDETDEDTALLARRFRKFMRKKGYPNKKRFELRKDGEKGKEKEKPKDPYTCFECGKTGHFKSECPMIKKSGWKKKKKAYIATWDDSESSSSGEEQEEVANVCLMATNDEEEVSSSPDFSFDELHEAFSDLMHEYKSLRVKFKSLKSENQDMLNKLKLKEELENQLESLKSENKTIKNHTLLKGARGQIEGRTKGKVEGEPEGGGMPKGS